MSNETCPREDRVLAARRSGRWDADLSEHVEQCPVCAQVSAVSEWMETLASQPDAPALPDADWLWLRAQIAARESSAESALRRSTLRRIAACALLGAGVAWVWLDGPSTRGSGLEAWDLAIASLSAEPFVTVAISALAALGIAALTAGLALGRTHVATRLRYFGLL
jgi:hypothetical protein